MSDQADEQTGADAANESADEATRESGGGENEPEANEAEPADDDD